MRLKLKIHCTSSQYLTEIWYIDIENPAHFYNFRDRRIPFSINFNRHLSTSQPSSSSHKIPQIAQNQGLSTQVAIAEVLRNRSAHKFQSSKEGSKLEEEAKIGRPGGYRIQVFSKPSSFTGYMYVILTFNSMTS